MRLPALTALLCLMASSAAADGFGFRTPSGNIYCNGGIQDPHLYCTIVNREAGSAPGNCPAGRQFEVYIQERGRVSGECGAASGRMSTYSDIADYGVSAQFGRISCRSETSGFTCTNADGRGFFLSRRSQRVF